MLPRGVSQVAKQILLKSLLGACLRLIRGVYNFTKGVANISKQRLLRGVSKIAKGVDKVSKGAFFMFLGAYIMLRLLRGRYYSF